LWKITNREEGMPSIKQLFARGEAAFTAYSPDGAQSRLWGNLDHAVHEATGFRPVLRRWITHDINSIMRFYTTGDEPPPPPRDPEEAVRKYASIPAEDLQYGHLVVRLFLAGPSLLTVWEGDDALAALLKVKGSTHPPEAQPGTIRGRMWCDNGVCNLMHTSDDYAEAERELKAVDLAEVLVAEPAALPLIDPIPRPTHYVAHSGIAVVCDVVRRMLMPLPDAPPFAVELPASGDARETHDTLQTALRDVISALGDGDIARFISDYLAGDVVAVTEMLKRLPVTPWEHFAIQCGAVTRDKWNG
jgi:nucleoside diphosphate kinase